LFCHQNSGKGGENDPTGSSKRLKRGETRNGKVISHYMIMKRLYFEEERQKMMNSLTTYPMNQNGQPKNFTMNSSCLFNTNIFSQNSPSFAEFIKKSRNDQFTPMSPTKSVDKLLPPPISPSCTSKSFNCDESIVEEDTLNNIKNRLDQFVNETNTYSPLNQTSVEPFHEPFELCKSEKHSGSQ
jgi:hypothetical protein